MRVLLHPAYRFGDVYGIQHPQRDSLRILASLMFSDSFGKLGADRDHRVKRGHRFLEDHGDLPAAYVAHGPIGQFRQVSAAQQDAAGGDLERCLWQQAHDR